ncbi:MAG: hypothetical protein QM296_01970, partial [Bacillota bacterium]|nr:hypothetical protein [Bacillota bacterium]
MSRGGQKMRWCPGFGAGAKKLSRGGQKMLWCPGRGAGAVKLVHSYVRRLAVCTAAFSIFMLSRKAAANEMRGGCHAGNTC